MGLVEATHTPSGEDPRVYFYFKCDGVDGPCDATTDDCDSKDRVWQEALDAGWTFHGNIAILCPACSPRFKMPEFKSKLPPLRLSDG